MTFLCVFAAIMFSSTVFAQDAPKGAVSRWCR